MPTLSSFEQMLSYTGSKIAHMSEEFAKTPRQTLQRGTKNHDCRAKEKQKKPCRYS